MWSQSLHLPPSKVVDVGKARNFSTVSRTACPFCPAGAAPLLDDPGILGALLNDPPLDPKTSCSTPVGSWRTLRPRSPSHPAVATRPRVPHVYVRGEHLSRELHALRVPGASPPTRGPHVREDRVRHRAGSIPAHAGTTRRDLRIHHRPTRFSGAFTESGEQDIADTSAPPPPILATRAGTPKPTRQPSNPPPRNAPTDPIPGPARSQYRSRNQRRPDLSTGIATTSDGAQPSRCAPSPQAQLQQCVRRSGRRCRPARPRRGSRPSRRRPRSPCSWRSVRPSRRAGSSRRTGRRWRRPRGRCRP